MKPSTTQHVRHMYQPIPNDPVNGSVVRPMDAKDGEPMKSVKNNSRVVWGVYIVLILMGLGTGYLLATKNTAGGSVIPSKNGSVASSGKIVGVQDASKYTNCPTGKIESGGLDGEGTHHLIRPGGASQTAYLMSSMIDLDQYVGLSVKVCGQTMQALKAPWLIDVERLEVQ